MVDIEARVDEDFIARHNLQIGASLLIDDEAAKRLYQELKDNNLISEEFAGLTDREFENFVHILPGVLDLKNELLKTLADEYGPQFEPCQLLKDHAKSNKKFHS